MGIDYDAYFGIGFDIEKFPDYKELETIDSNDDFLNHCLKETNYEYLSYGDAYSGEIYYAVILNDEVVPRYDALAEQFVEFRKELIKLHDFLIGKGFTINDYWISGGGLIS